MTGFGWFLIGYFAVAATMSILRIGKATKPLSPGVAVGVVLIDAALIVCILSFGTGILS